MSRSCETVVTRYSLPEIMYAAVCQRGEIRALFLRRSSACLLVTTGPACTEHGEQMSVEAVRVGINADAPLIQPCDAPAPPEPEPPPQEGR